MTHVELSLCRQRALWGEVSARAAALSAPGRRRLLLFGLGSSGHCAHLTAETLAFGSPEPPACWAGSPLDVGRLVAPRPGDLAVAFSHRGKTPPTLAALERCRRAGAATAMICAAGAAQSRCADTVLATGPVERCEPHTSGMTGAVCAATSWLGGREAAAAWQRLAAAPDPDLAAFRRDAGEAPDVVVGHGAGRWVAREGALKFVEMARRPVCAFDSEEYFHGWAFARAGAVVWHVAAPQDPRAQLVSARRFAVSPEALGWVEALVQLQWLALAFALERGLDPDEPLTAKDKS